MHMGRRRADNPLGLPPRVYAKHGAFFYVHASGKWEHLGTDLREAKRKGTLYNDPASCFGTIAYWLDAFIVHCQARVGLSRERRGIKPRTFEDYRRDIEPLKAFFGKMLPSTVLPAHVGKYLELGAELNRAVRANREKACLSACFTWLMLQADAGVRSNPCVGVKRNPEFKRLRYVTDAELRAVLAIAPKMVCSLLWLVYRTLQRPEDVITWSAANAFRKGDKRVLRHVQAKGDKMIEIEFSDELDAIWRDLNANSDGTLRGPGMPLIHRLDGQAYTYDGLSSMLRRAVEAAGVAGFGFYDMKGKGATDMWRAGVPLEQIQLLCGHDSVTTTEIYVKARWVDTVQPNRVVVG